MNAYRVGACAEGGAITCHSYAGNRDILFRNKLMRAIVLREIPNADTASTITSNDLALIGVDYYVVDG